MKTFVFFNDIITEQKLPKEVTGLLFVQKIQRINIHKFLSFYYISKEPEAIRLDSRINCIAEIVNKRKLQPILYKRFVLIHDTRSNNSRSNDARFIHKLCKHT